MPVMAMKIRVVEGFRVEILRSSRLRVNGSVVACFLSLLVIAWLPLFGCFFNLGFLLMNASQSDLKILSKKPLLPRFFDELAGAAEKSRFRWQI